MGLRSAQSQNLRQKYSRPCQFSHGFVLSRLFRHTLSSQGKQAIRFVSDFQSFLLYGSSFGHSAIIHGGGYRTQQKDRSADHADSPSSDDRLRSFILSLWRKDQLYAGDRQSDLADWRVWSHQLRGGTQVGSFG